MNPEIRATPAGGRHPHLPEAAGIAGCLAFRRGRGGARPEEGARGRPAP